MSYNPDGNDDDACTHNLASRNTAPENSLGLVVWTPTDPPNDALVPSISSKPRNICTKDIVNHTTQGTDGPLWPRASTPSLAERHDLVPNSEVEHSPKFTLRQNYPIPGLQSPQYPSSSPVARPRTPSSMNKPTSSKAPETDSIVGLFGPHGSQIHLVMPDVRERVRCVPATYHSPSMSVRSVPDGARKSTSNAVALRNVQTSSSAARNPKPPKPAPTVPQVCHFESL